MNLFRYVFSKIDESASYMVDSVGKDDTEAREYVEKYIEENSLDVGNIVLTDVTEIKHGILTILELPAEEEQE